MKREYKVPGGGGRLDRISSDRVGWLGVPMRLLRHTKIHIRYNLLISEQYDIRNPLVPFLTYITFTYSVLTTVQVQLCRVFIFHRAISLLHHADCFKGKCFCKI
jgi:hypothetical protein